MIIGSQVEQTNDIEEMLHFYKATFQSVEVVRCDKCKEYIAVELFGGEGMGMQPNELGKFVVPVGDKLLSHRVRLDEAPTGEHMVGYQCACGNDTRIAEIERGKVPVGLNQVALSPFERFKITEDIRQDTSYTADFSKRGNKKKFESFSVERME